MKILITESQYKTLDKVKFVVDAKRNKFKLFLGIKLVAESGFNIIQSDEWFDENYVILFNLKTKVDFQGKGYAKRLLEQIFKYVKNEFNLSIVTLIVYKNNSNAVNLYLKVGFDIFMEYDDSYSLIKKL